MVFKLPIYVSSCYFVFWLVFLWSNPLIFGFCSSSPDEQKDNEVVRDVFGDSDEDERDEFGGQNDLEQDSHVRLWLSTPLILYSYSILNYHNCSFYLEFSF